MANNKKNCGPPSYGFVQKHENGRDLCVHRVSAEIKCSLGDSKHPDHNIPPCYSTTGKAHFEKLSKNAATVKAAQSHKHKAKPTLSATCSQLLPFGDASSGGRPKLIEDITYLQQRETVLMTKLRKEVTKQGGGDQSVEDDYLNQIRIAQDTRMRLLKELANAYTSSQCSLSSDRVALQDQLAMVELAESQLKHVTDGMKALLDSRTNKHRMVQITNYEYDRYASHTSIFRTMAYCSLFILGGIALNNMGWKTVGNIVIVLAVVALVISTVGKIWTNWWRSPMNWNQFNWWNPEKTSHYETVWEHDKKAFDRGYNEAISETKHLYKDASKGVDKAFDSVKKGVGGATRDIGKDIGANTTHHKHHKHHRENFAHY